MLKNWKPKLAVISGLLLGIITWLGFFGVSAQTLREQMTSHYLFLVAAILCTGIVISGIYYWWKSSRITPENVHLKIREWLDAFKISHCPMSWDAWHFRYDVTFWNQIIFVGRPKLPTGRYIHIELRTTGVLPQHASAFAALTPFEKVQFESNIALEIARARVSFNRHKVDYSDVSITTLLPITSEFSATDFLNGLIEVYQGGVIVWNAIALRLDKSPEIKPPSLVHGTEASPPKPT